jgi:TonB family protein
MAMSSQRKAITGIQQNMMSAHANSVQKPERFDMHVRKFRSICVMHGFQIGSDSELESFLRKLLDDRHLAMDFWAFVGKVSNREGGDLSDDQLLSVIVEGITNTDASEVDADQQRTINDLRAMLAGVDIQGPEQSPVEMAPFPRKEPASDQAEDHPWTKSAESPIPPLNPKPRFSFHAVDSHSDVDNHPVNAKDVAYAAAPSDPRPVDETLLRLELTRLLQQYFEHIDKRIGRPTPDPDASTGNIAPAVTRRSLQEPATEAEEEEVRFKRLGRSRLVLEPSPFLPAENPIQVTDDDLPIRIPLEHYSPPPRFGKAPIMLVLVLIGAGLEIYRDPSLLRHGFDIVARQFRAENALVRVNTPKEPPVNTGPSQSSTTQSEVPSNSEKSLPAALLPSFRGSSTPSPAETPNPTAPSADLQTIRNRLDSSNSHAPDRAQAQSEPAPEDPKSSIESAGAINVSPSVMDRNLIVSRVPAYPEFARTSRVEGDVVMRALISKEGTVERVHVMQGDSRLRSAAEDAVYKWRYRPYVLNGQPVEVATTVTVNFNLNR